jgi:hypothetical protein
LFDAKNLRGHHWIPFDSLKGLDISDDALRFWGAAKSGATIAGDHVNNAAHIAYNGAVRSELLAYAAEKGISLAEMTREQAIGFTNHILRTSSNSVINNYVSHISASVASRAASFGSSAAGRAAGVVVRAIGSVGVGLMLESGDAR